MEAIADQFIEAEFENPEFKNTECAGGSGRDRVSGMRVLIGLVAAASCCAQSAKDLEAVITTDLGTFRFEFAADQAPKHVEHFIKLAREGYYDGGAFHRTVAYGIIQGGDPLLKDA